jgi:hypothetical protein
VLFSDVAGAAADAISTALTEWAQLAEDQHSECMTVVRQVLVADELCKGVLCTEAVI